MIDPSITGRGGTEPVLRGTRDDVEDEGDGERTAAERSPRGERRVEKKRSQG